MSGLCFHGQVAIRKREGGVLFCLEGDFTCGNRFIEIADSTCSEKVVICSVL